MNAHELGQRAIVVAQIEAAHASASLLLEMFGDKPTTVPASAVPHLHALVASLAAAIVLLGVEFEAAEATPAGPARPGCPACQAPAARQRNVTGMGEQIASWVCLDCGEGYERGES